MSKNTIDNNVLEAFDEILAEMKVFGLDTDTVDWKKKFIKRVSEKL